MRRLPLPAAFAHLLPCHSPSTTAFACPTYNCLPAHMPLQTRLPATRLTTCPCLRLTLPKLPCLWATKIPPLHPAFTFLLPCALCPFAVAVIRSSIHQAGEAAAVKAKKAVAGGACNLGMWWWCCAACPPSGIVSWGDKKKNPCCWGRHLSPPALPPPARDRHDRDAFLAFCVCALHTHALFLLHPPSSSRGKEGSATFLLMPILVFIITQEIGG